MFRKHPRDPSRDAKPLFGRLPTSERPEGSLSYSSLDKDVARYLSSPSERATDRPRGSEPITRVPLKRSSSPVAYGQGRGAVSLQHPESNHRACGWLPAWPLDTDGAHHKGCTIPHTLAGLLVRGLSYQDLREPHLSPSQYQSRSSISRRLPQRRGNDEEEESGKEALGDEDL